MGLKKLEDLKDPKLDELVGYIEEIESENKWEEVVLQDWFSVKKLDGSKYNSTYPFTKVQMELEKDIPLHVLLEQFNNPDLRRSWDGGIKKIEIIEGNYPNDFIVYNTLEVLFFKGDYVERKATVIYKDSVMVLCYSVGDEKKPPQKGYNRGCTILSVSIYKNEGQKTKITIFNQTDPNSKLAKAAKDLGPRQLKSWCNKCKNALMKAAPSKGNN